MAFVAVVPAEIGERTPFEAVVALEATETRGLTVVPEVAVRVAAAVPAMELLAAVGVFGGRDVADEVERVAVAPDVVPARELLAAVGVVGVRTEFGRTVVAAAAVIAGFFSPATDEEGFTLVRPLIGVDVAEVAEGRTPGRTVVEFARMAAEGPVLACNQV